jgi:beta-lactam-binding protein with PASTA domain
MPYPGPGLVNVPRVIDLNRTQAEAVLADVGLTVGVVSYDHTCNTFAGDIVMQHPLQGEHLLPYGAPVDITVETDNDGHGHKCIVK